MEDMRNDNMPEGGEDRLFDDTVGVVYGGPLPELPEPVVRPSLWRVAAAYVVGAVVTIAVVAVELIVFAVVYTYFLK